MTINIITAIFLILAMIVFTGGAVGIIRFPDFYSRLHPAGKLDTMGILLSMLGLAVYNLHEFSLGTLLTSLKLLLIVTFVFITSPTATHAIVDAGVRAGLRPWAKTPDKEKP
jgi:multicomponent Na+:H+ antiporter subunit G